MTPEGVTQVTVPPHETGTNLLISLWNHRALRTPRVRCGVREPSCIPDKPNRAYEVRKSMQARHQRGGCIHQITFHQCATQHIAGAAHGQSRDPAVLTRVVATFPILGAASRGVLVHRLCEEHFESKWELNLVRL